MRSWLAPAVGLLAFGCGNAASEGPVASASAVASSSPPAAAPTPSVQAPAPPDDLDVATIQKTLKCANDTKASGACGVLAKFAACKPWNPVTPNGDGRWIGRGVEVDKGKSSDVFVILRARRTPTSEVGPGQLGAKIAIEEIPKTDKDAYDGADRAIRILERQDVPPRYNPTLDYLKKREQWTESLAVATPPAARSACSPRAAASSASARSSSSSSSSAPPPAARTPTASTPRFGRRAGETFRCDDGAERGAIRVDRPRPALDAARSLIWCGFLTTRRGTGAALSTLG